MKKGDCWIKLFIKADKVTVSPTGGEHADELSEAPMHPSSVTQSLEASEQSLKSKLPFPASVCKFAF